MSIAKISELLTLLIKKIVIDGFDAYSIKHAYTTKLAELGIQERDLNMFTKHELDSKSERNYYVFAANRQVNGIAARLVTIYHCMENQDSTSTNISQQKRNSESPNVLTRISVERTRVEDTTIANDEGHSMSGRKELTQLMI
ncbi:MAG: hypothetical protein EZS28_020233 [Streblomastix strix]|uniref:Tyr recombinase domain-containing protein n=1 Tax=Streblomastix strix TaxID=222440 RepID=A0A5J4VPI4_9EUKA|nr:MAG: hypothetical protein EZS28_020233 [Streblomastix strix]